MNSKVEEMDDREMDARDELAAYFKARPEFARIFAAMRKKWESLGRTAGRVVLSPAAAEERRALERFLGLPMPEDKIIFTLPGFEQALQETRYGPVSLKALLEAYFGEPLMGDQEKKQDKKSREERFWAGLEEELAKSGMADKEALGWIWEMREQRDGGYVTLMKEYRRSEEAARKLALQIAQCLRACRGIGQWEGGGPGKDSPVSGPGIRLAVLAARVTGNPHALDRQHTAGTLLSYALCRREGSAFPQNAREWKELYEKNGIWIDELSSTVAAYGIHLLVEQERLPHPAYEGYCERKEPCVISLANLGCARAAYGDSESIYIVENEMVFSALLEQLSPYPVALLCTSGQPRTAAYRLLELLGENGHPFYYAGDLDPEGLAIAERIWRSFPENVQIWRMSEEDYAKAISKELVSKRRLDMLKELSHPKLRKTAEQIRRHGRAGYQELLLEDMAQDVLTRISPR